jgi:hypothetical protein
MKHLPDDMKTHNFTRNVNNWKKPGTKGARIRDVLIFPSCSLLDVDSDPRALTF